jgi:hypothetical protein
MKYIKSYNLFESDNKSTQVSVPTKYEMLKMLRKNFANYTNPGSTFPVEVKNKEGKTLKTLEFHFDKDGELHFKENISESKFTKGLAALCLIGGMLTSCKKDSHQGFGYNLNSGASAYIINSNGNKEIDIFNSSGNLTKTKVDSTERIPVQFYRSSGLHVARRLTPTEAFIIKAGLEYETEIKYNQGSGSKVYDATPYDVYISSEGGKLYQEAAAGRPTKDCREHGAFKSGLQALSKKGFDTKALLNKADQEVNSGTWFTSDDDIRMNSAKELKQNPITLDSSNYDNLFKTYGTVSFGSDYNPKDGRLFLQTYGTSEGPFIETSRSRKDKVGIGQLRISSKGNGVLNFLGGSDDDLKFENGFWSYSNGSKTYKLKLIWDGETLQLYDGNKKMRAFTKE